MGAEIFVKCSQVVKEEKIKKKYYDLVNHYRKYECIKTF